MDLNYSVILPIKDEEDNIESLIQEIENVMAALKNPWELICVDDGSTDKSLEILKTLAEKKSFIRLIVFDGNFGQSSAFDVGFREAKGTLVITLDADGQNDPADIPKLIDLMSEADLVCGWRTNRKDTWSKKIISTIANKVRGCLIQDGVHDTGCSLKVYRKSCFPKIKLYHGMHRFLPALFMIEGFRVREVPVSHRERQGGVSKYHFFNRSLAPFVDLFAVAWMRRRQLKYRISKGK